MMSFTLPTERLILDDLTPMDLTNIHRIAYDPDFMKHVLIWIDTDEQIQNYLDLAITEAQKKDRREYILAARTKENNAFAGLTFIEIDSKGPSTAEIGITLLPEFTKKGYGSEILNAYIAFGFETLKMHRVYAKCDTRNIPSARLMEHCGLIYEGTIREHVWLRDHWRSSKYYGMLADEYFQLKG